ncbi:hypothetical protein [Streptomyces lydicus]|uniref:hypothetical protein n=1 Tax=Streptomyces lydicus TaxID=47763 RepID=UPI0036EA8F4D
METDSNLPQNPEVVYPLTQLEWARWIGLQEVTERNWRKAYIRAVQVQAAHGPDALQITPELVRHHFGVKLGPFQLSDAAFRKDLGVLYEGRLTRELEQWEHRRSRGSAASSTTT